MVTSARDSWLSDSNEVAQRGDALYAQYVDPEVKPADQGKFVAIDLGTGAFEIDDNELIAVTRIRERLPGALVWITRVGSRHAHHFGATHSIDAA